MAAEPARLLNDRYRVLRPIGRGGMGAVYEAIDQRLHNTVAVKEMTADGDEALRAFEREAQLLAALRHQALPVVTDYFIERGARFLVMQYIEGENLAHRFKRTGRQPWDDVERWGVEVLRALIYLHGHHPPIVHRDIKPANIALTPRGDVVLLDFGLAKGRPGQQTRTGIDDPSIFGFTPGYAPPEQLAASGTDARSDLYSLAATLYHLACGAPPPGAHERMTAVHAGRPDLLAIESTLPVRLGAVLLRALALDPAARFQSAQEMLDALQQGAHDQPRPAPNPLANRARRLDAAAPSQAEVGREIDLLVQVRFADSPRLGLEDWPTRRKPAQIEQVSEAVDVSYPVEPVTGRRLPGRVRVKIVAPDFTIQGASEQLIDVPPEEYSKRLAFLLAPKRVGYCRINIEVYSAADAVYLGSLAVEAEALVTLHGEPERHVADLVLGVGVATRDEVKPVATRGLASANEPIVRETPARRASIREDVARRRREELAKLLEMARLSLDAGLTERAGRYCEEALVLDPDHAEVLAVYERVCSATAQGSRPDTAIVRTAPVMPPSPSTGAMPATASARVVPQWMYGAVSAAVVLVAVVVWQTAGTPSTSPTMSAPATNVRTAAEPATTPTPAATPGAVTTEPPPTKAQSPPTAVAAAPPPASAPGSAVPVAKPITPSAPTRPAPPAPLEPRAMDPRGPARSVVSTSHAGVVLTVVAVDRRGEGSVRVSLRLDNDSSSSIDFAIDPGATTLTAGGVAYRVVAGAAAVAPVAAGGRLDDWLEFAIPDRLAGAAVLHFASKPGAPRFPELSLSLPGH